MKNGTIKFNTGRYYSPEGQIIEAYEVGDYDKAIDALLDGMEKEQYVIFKDLSRGISGKITLCKLTEIAIMSRYDSGDYTDI